MRQQKKILVPLSNTEINHGFTRTHTDRGLYPRPSVFIRGWTRVFQAGF